MGSESNQEATDKLNNLFFDLWRLGSNALVGWMPSNTGIEILTAPKIRLFSLEDPHPRTFVGSRRMEQDEFREVARSLGVQPIEVRLDTLIGERPGDIPPGHANELFSIYTTTKTEQRAVFLMDIVGFSKFSPEHQASQLASVDFALNIAAETAKSKGLEVDLARSTTGDGFYVWNRNDGFEADIALFTVMALFLTFHAALKKEVSEPNAIPQLRNSFSIGSHYGFYQPDRSGRGQSEFIVGEVTISLARVIGGARTDQILIGAFDRLDQESGKSYSTAQFVEAASVRIADISGLSVLNNEIEKFSIYLTGPRKESGEYRNQRLRIVDKHNFEHICFNAKLNIHMKGAEPYFTGLQHTDLLKPG